MRIDYEADFYLWALEQAELLRQRKFSAIDCENLAEEIEDMARHSHRELTHRVQILVKHLLKWQYQPVRRSSSWMSTIEEQRDQLTEMLKIMPSLRRFLDDPDWLDIRWQRAQRSAQRETRVGDMPDKPCWTLDQLLDQDFYPD